MGKASSNKKVARAARAGGRASIGQPRGLLFPGIIALVFVLGIALVWYARDDRQDDDLGGVPQLGDHIHQAIAFNACGEFLDALPEFETPVGIHTHGDGVIHIHPFSQLGVGANATLERYLEDARDDGGLEVELSNDELTYLGQTYEEGDQEACAGIEDPQLRMAYWEDVQGEERSEPQITTGGFTDRRLTTDGAGITIFFGDPDAEIPRPPNADQLATLGAADGGQVPDEEGNTTTSTSPEPTTSTAPADPAATSSSVPADPSATTVAP